MIPSTKTVIVARASKPRASGDDPTFATVEDLEAR